MDKKLQSGTKKVSSTSGVVIIGQLYGHKLYQTSFLKYVQDQIKMN